MDHSLEAQVRAADEDRWLASRFVADPARRVELVGLYALNLELARTAAGVSNPLVGEMRLEWWREGLEEIAAGRPARAPALQALLAATAEGRLDRAALERLIEARRRDLDPAPFEDEPALERYLDDTAGALMLAAARLLAPETPPGAVQAAARAWGWTAWARARPALEAAGRRWAPEAWEESSPEEATAHAAHRIAEALTEARAELRALPALAFPAVAYVSVARERGALAKRLQLLWAVLRGVI